MARRKLIDYLNDPMLLHSISVEEMQAWAEEVPYAGLVQRLLAQKLALEGTEGVFADKARTMAVISNANPDHTIKTIEDFKEMLLSEEDTDTQGANDVSSTDGPSDMSLDQSGIPVGHSISDEDQVLMDMELDDDTLAEEASSALDEEMEAEQNVDLSSTAIAFDDAEESEFTQWLSGLKSIDTDREDDTDIQLREKALASTALAELLVSQGHYARAIEMYKVLMLKNPQKSSFFAAQIEKVEAL